MNISSKEEIICSMYNCVIINLTVIFLSVKNEFALICLTAENPQRKKLLKEEIAYSLRYLRSCVQKAETFFRQNVVFTPCRANLLAHHLKSLCELTFKGNVTYRNFSSKILLFNDKNK